MTVRPKRDAGRDTITAYRITTRDGTTRTLWRIAWMEPLPTNPGELRRRFKRGFETRDSAERRLEEIRVDMRRGEHQAETHDTLDTFAGVYLDTIRVKDSTRAGYRKHFRVHVASSPLAGMKLAAITKDHLNRFYRQLERSGRKDAGHVGEPLGPATVRHVHVLLSQIFAAAVDDGLLRVNPAKKASPPSKLDAAAPEMETWTAEQTRAFLTWSRERGDYLWCSWYTLLSTGMRRGELLALRWRDVDFENQTLSIVRALSYVKEAGVKPVMTFTKPKSGRGRNVDIDDDLLTALRERRDEMTRKVPELAAPNALVFSNRYGQPHNPVQFSRQWRERCAQAQRDMPDLPRLHLHELRHTHATLLLRAGEHPKVVSERLGHADVNITLAVYSHVTTTLQRHAATAIGGLLRH